MRAVWIVASALILASSLPALAESSEPSTERLELAAPRHWRLETDKGPVHVWTPAGYDRRTAATVVYVHGYHMSVDDAWSYHDLPTQFERAHINALFIAPAAPKGSREPVVWLSLYELLRVTEQGIQEKLPAGRLVAAAYSGGHRTLDCWLPNAKLDTLVLLDAMYGDIRPYAYWIRGSAKRRLIVLGDDTRIATDRFHRWVPAQVRVEDLDQFADKFYAAHSARRVYLRSTLGHWDLLDGGEALPAILGLVARPL